MTALPPAARTAAPKPSRPISELIPVAEEKVGDGLIRTVNARDLHAFLEVETRFNDWISRRIEAYDFVDGRDFVTQKRVTDGTEIDCHLTLDMAKELSMVESNALGKEARLYFTKFPYEKSPAFAGLKVGA
jgi:anti-repressor protein